MAGEIGLDIDEAGLEKASQEAKEVSRGVGKKDGGAVVKLDVHDLGKLEGDDSIPKTEDSAKFGEFDASPSSFQVARLSFLVPARPHMLTICFCPLFTSQAPPPSPPPSRESTTPPPSFLPLPPSPPPRPPSDSFSTAPTSTLSREGRSTTLEPLSSTERPSSLLRTSRSSRATSFTSEFSPRESST